MRRGQEPIRQLLDLPAETTALAIDSITSVRTNVDARSVKPAGPPKRSYNRATWVSVTASTAARPKQASNRRASNPAAAGFDTPACEEGLGVHAVVLAARGVERGHLRSPRLPDSARTSSISFRRLQNVSIAVWGMPVTPR